jgi:hypothetical protein
MNPAIPLTIRQFESMEDFRAEKGLASDFGISLFQPKNYAGLGSIKNAGEALRQLHNAVVEAVPARLPALGWQASLVSLQMLFQAKLREINPQIGLRTSEIDYAVSGFGEVMQRYLYALMSARLRGQPAPDFEDIYEQWLNSTIVYTLEHIRFLQEDTDEVWQVQVAAHAFGRFGLIVQTPIETRYLRDSSILCPAAGFMESLFREVACGVESAIYSETEHAGRTA